MRVVLLAYSQPASKELLTYFKEQKAPMENMIDTYARLTRRTDSFENVLGETVDDGKTPERIESYIKQGHFTVAGFIDFTFLIEGISRACSHELVRHRTGWYLQQTQRRVDLEGVPCTVPDSITKSSESTTLFTEAIAKSKDIYNKLIERGVPLEDARFVMPNAIQTRIIMKIDGSNLMHFLKLRTSKDAMWEIRKLAYLMWQEAQKVCPNLFSAELQKCWW